MALKTNILQKDYIKNQISGTENATGAGAASFSVISSTNDFKSQQFESEKLFAEQNAMKPVADLYGDLTVKLASYAKEYPELTTALSGATIAIKAMTAAAVVFAGVKFFSGGGVGGVGAPPVGPGGIRPPGTLGRIMGTVGRTAGRIATPFALYQASQDAPLVQVECGDADARKRLQANQYSDDLTRLKDSARAQPGLLDAWDEAKSWWSAPTSIGKGDMATAGVPSYLLQQQNQKPQPIQFTTKLVIDERVLAEVVNEYNND